MKRILVALAATSLVATLGACGGPASDADRDNGAGLESEITAANGAITVAGNRLLRDGRDWVPKGLSLIGALTHGSAVEAYQHWGNGEIAAAKSFGADALRFQVSQPTLDPQDAKYSAPYLQRLKDMVALARANGFAVILSMQDQSLAGGDASPMPTASTERAWNALAPVFAEMTDVMYELYNEPQNEANAAGWAMWKNGGNGNVGHQALLNRVRALGSKNVILVDGARLAEILTDVPLLNDPRNSVVYAFHPYYMNSILADPQAWDKRFGNLGLQVPVLATEWNARSGDATYCKANDPVMAVRLLDYLAQHKIGIFGWAFDLEGTLIKDWNFTPTDYVNYTCGTSRGGAGALLKSRFTR